MAQPSGEQLKGKAFATPGLLDSLRSLTGGRTGVRQVQPTVPRALKVATEAEDFDFSSHDTSRRNSIMEEDFDFYAFAEREGGFSGAPEGFDDMFGELGHGWPPEIRARAARRIAAVLEDYPLDNVISIWLRARDIVDFITTPEACHAGYALLVACSKCTTLGPSERDTFLSCVERFLTLNGERTQTIPQEYLIYQVQVLSELTEHGRDLHSMERRVVSVVELLFEASYNYVFSERRKAKAARPHAPSGSRPTAPSMSYEPLEQTFEYTSDLIKYNSKAIGDDAIRDLVEAIFEICRRTVSARDIQLAIKVLDTLFTYAFPADSVFQSSLEILCNVHPLVGMLQDESWEVTFALLKSHRGQTVAEALLKIMTNASSYESTRPNVVRGAGQIMGKWIGVHEYGRLPYPPVPALLTALKATLQLRKKSREMHFLRLMGRLVMRREQVEDLLEGAGWEDFTQILLDCVAMQVEWSHPNRPISPVLSRSESSMTVSNPPLVAAEGPKLIEPVEFSRMELESIIRNLLDFTADIGYDNRLTVTLFALNTLAPLSDEIVERVMAFYVEQGLLGPSTSGWIINCSRLLETVFNDPRRSVTCRKSVLKIVAAAYQVGHFCGDPNVRSPMLSLVGRLHVEAESELVTELVGLALHIGVSTTSESDFEQLMQILLTAIFSPSGEFNPSTAEEDSTLNTWSTEGPYHTALEMIGSKVAICLVRLFLRTVNKSNWKCQRVFKALLEVASSVGPHPKARITVLKALFRIRSDVHYRIYITPDTQCQTVAASLCRTVETSRDASSSAPNDAIAQDELMMKPRKPTSSASAEQPRPASGKLRIDVRRQTPPLWIYPGPGGLPEAPAPAASEILSSRPPTDQGNADTRSRRKSVLPMGLWLEAVLRMLTGVEFEWETYSYILVHMGVQLSNHSLFVNATKEVNYLRAVICRQLISSTFYDAPSFTNLKKSDVASCFYHMLTMLISYHKQFTKPEEDDIVKVFLLGIGTREGNAERCIHALSVCCHELPASIIKSLDGILQAMSRIVTQSQVAVHILEFLTGLARSPELFKNLSQEQYGTVFGICCQYLRYARDQKETAAFQSTRQASVRYSNSGRDEPKPKSLAEELPQYVYAMAYHAITFWFMSLRLEDRPARMADLTRQLHYVDNHGVQQLEEQSETTIDMMQRVSYSDRDETRYLEEFAKLSEDGRVTRKNWLVGCSILTIETAGRSGKSQLIRRRASGTRYSIYQPQLTFPPPHQAPINRGSAADAYYRDDWVGVMPEDILQEFYSPLGPTIEAPILLPEDDITKRAINSFDRIPALDSHKIGVIYIGESQTEEATILANVMGSADYTAFLTEMGTLTKLEGAKFNTHGLDREFNMDGNFTYCWRDRVSEMVFHVTTMMPTNLERDPLGTQKKKHIGNDFVNIVFNNSGLPFDTNTFPSDFNYVNIIISPEARATFLDTRLAEEETDTTDATNATNAGAPKATPFDGMFYRVTVLSKEGLPKISPASETKIVSFRSLATFIRPIALNASVFSSVWAAGRNSEHLSSWRTRLRAIKTIRERNQPVRDAQDHTSPPGTAWGPISAPPVPGSGPFSPPATTRDMPLLSQLPRSRSGMFTGGALPAERESAFHSGPRAATAETSAYRRQSATPEVITAAANAAARNSLGGSGSLRSEDPSSATRRGSESSEDIPFGGSRARLR